MAKNGKTSFISPSCGVLTPKRMIEEIRKFVESDQSSRYRLVIGTDSQVRRLNGTPHCDYVTAIVIYRTGRGARYFWHKKKEKTPSVLREKIYTETTKSLEVAELLVPSIREAISPVRYDLEIHIDVGPLGETRDMIKEVTGIVIGNGYTPRTKPGSWAASSVADRHT